MQTQASKKHRDQQEPPPTCQAGPKPRDTVPREQWLQLQGKEAPSHLLLVLYFTFWCRSHARMSTLTPILLYGSPIAMR